MGEAIARGGPPDTTFFIAHFHQPIVRQVGAPLAVNQTAVFFTAVARRGGGRFSSDFRVKKSRKEIKVKKRSPAAGFLLMLRLAKARIAKSTEMAYNIFYNIQR